MQTQKQIHGWEWKKLGETIGENGLFTDGNWILSENMSDSGTIRVIQLGDIGDGKFIDKSSKWITEETCKNLKCTLLRENDVLISRMADPIARACLLPHLKNQSITAVDITIMRCDKSIILPKFVMFICNSPKFREEAERLGRGTTRRRITRKDLGNLKIPVPPLEVQKQIVAVLERAEKLKQRREQINEETKKSIQAIFVEMFGDPIKNDKGFAVEEFENIASKERYGLKRGPFGGSLKKEIFVSEGYKVYEQQHAIKNNFKLGDYYITSEKYEEMKPFALHPEDIIISCSGTIGKIAIVPKNAKPGIINQALLKLTIDKEKTTPIFIKYLLETPSVQRLFFGNARGSGIQNVASMPFIRSTKIPVPPLSLQKEFEKIVERIESIKNHQLNSTNEINVLFDALMQKAFNGEITNG